MRGGRLYCIFILILICISIQVPGQDTISINTGISWFQSTKNEFQSHWLLHNQGGIVKDSKSQLLLYGGISIPYSITDKWIIVTGANYILKPGDYKSFLQELYFKSNIDVLEFRLGKQNRTVGIFYPDLASGSMAMSHNARPLPVVGAGIPEYWAIPGTKGYLEIKGYLLHGWFEKDRYVESPWLHEKWMYVRIGEPLPVSVSGGFVHFAQWAGIHPDRGQLPYTFKDYIKVFFGEGGGSGGEAVNALGNHLGVYDVGIDIKFDPLNIHFYHQKPWDDETGLTVIFEDPDRLWGMGIEFKDIQIVSGILYEFMHTTTQTRPGIPDPTEKYPTPAANYGYPFGGRDDYYNNYLYKSGWTYHDMIIGTPLFYTQARARKFMPDLSDTYGNIVNNRIIGHHFGIKGGYKTFNYRILGTYTRNHGTFAGANKGRHNWASKEEPDFNYEFDPPLDQFYFLIETEWTVNNRTSGIFRIGYDTGDIYDNFGFQLGVNYSFELPYSLKRKQETDNKGPVGKALKTWRRRLRCVEWGMRKHNKYLEN
ncbi:capsule assembly Wzi family protein [Bacteroidota bacterium]